MSQEVVSYRSQGLTRITVRTETGCVLDEKIIRRERVLLKGVGVPVSYPDCGDIYPAALSQARGWLAEFANQKTLIDYDSNGRPIRVVTMDATGTTLISTKTLLRDDSGQLLSLTIEEAVSGKTITRTFTRDPDGHVTAVDRVFTRRT